MELLKAGLAVASIIAVMMIFAALLVISGRMVLMA